MSLHARLAGLVLEESSDRETSRFHRALIFIAVSMDAGRVTVTDYVTAASTSFTSDRKHIVYAAGL